ncbi:MAG TPA: hypothetical protein VFB68_01945 [Xanthobacteraceae bacterium]|nr:hypothetical protein [Xanthobacteraceae bacterium]
MSKPQHLRDIGLVFAGVLAGACLFSLPKQASSAFREGDAVVGAIIIEKEKRNRQQNQPDNSEGWGGITRNTGYYGPFRVSSRLFPDHDDCDVAKLDVWLNNGLLTYSLLPDAEGPAAESTDVPGKTTMLIGGKNCQVRIVIERADGRNGGQ